MRKQHQARALTTSQHDNVMRDGVVTTNQAMDMFKRAGLTTKEWLIKTYGTNPREPSEEEKRNIEEIINKRGDKLDYYDDIREINKNIESSRAQIEKLKEENKKIEEYIKKSADKNKENIDNKQE